MGSAGSRAAETLSHFTQMEVTGCRKSFSEPPFKEITLEGSLGLGRQRHGGVQMKENFLFDYSSMGTLLGYTVASLFPAITRPRLHVEILPPPPFSDRSEVSYS